MAISRICSIEGCGKPVDARGWCSAHWYRWRKHGDPLGGGKTPGNVQKYYKEVVLVYEGDECLIWPFGRGNEGYGRMWRDGGMRLTHRLVCEDLKGPPPTPEHEAAHSCGRGHFGCCAPKHLEWKTRAENAADKLIHGTDNRGEKSPLAKLTEEQVRQIKSMRGKFLQREIAEMYGVHTETIGFILRGESWRHLMD